MPLFQQKALLLFGPLPLYLDFQVGAGSLRNSESNASCSSQCFLQRLRANAVAATAPELSTSATDVHIRLQIQIESYAFPLAILMASDGLQPLMTRAVAAAARRSRELGS